MNKLIETLREERTSLRSALTAITDTAADEKRDLNDTESKNFDDLVARAEAVQARLSQLEEVELRTAAGYELSSKVDTAAGKPRIENVKEAELYRADNSREVSFIRDIVASELDGDYDARERLQRHNQFARAGVVSTDMAGLITPKYLTDLLTPIAHEGRPFANIVNRKELVGRVAYITKQVTQTDVGAQATENSTVASSEPDWTDVTVTANTYAGSVVISRQSIDFGSQSDTEIVSDLYRTYAQKLDDAIINGTGSSGTHEGLFNLDGINTVDGSTVSDYGDLWVKVGSAKTAVRKSQVGQATHAIMNSDMWGWITSQTDADGRPLVGFAGSAPQNVGGNVEAYEWNGLTVIVDDNHATETNGSLADTNNIFVVNARQLFLWEQNGGTPRQIRVESATGLNVTIAAYGYSAFYGERYPLSVAIVSDIPVGV